MKRYQVLLGLTAMLFFSACQKQNDYKNNAKENSKDDWENRSGGKENNDGEYGDMVFYLLGEGNILDRYTSDRFEKKGSAAISGLGSGAKILAIDFRPATGQLYGVGSDSRIYVINPLTGVARAIGSGPFTPAINGNSVSFDFNPTVDRIRLVTNSGQNLRLNPETGAVAVVDGSVNGVANAMITSVAYGNNVAGAATTTLYDIDISTDKLYRQDPPNNGTLVEIGSFKVNLEGDGGFDIAPADFSGKKKSSDNAIAVYQLKGVSTLFSINLTSGKASKIEKFKCNQKYYAIAILTQPVAYAVSGSNFLIFNPNTTGGVVTKTLTGLQSGESVLGIDFRPVNGQIYALGSNSRLYTINTSSGAATFVATLSIALNGTSFGFDFNPLVDRIRIVSNNGQNLRANPADGVTIMDGSLNPGTPSVNAAAYANNFAGTTSTTLYVVDSGNDKLYMQNPPNAGTLVEIGNLGINAESGNGFDIGGTSNMAYGVFTTGMSTRIYSVNISTGSASPKGSLPGMVTGFTIGLGF
ncbi:MAG: DUF4394 domain-containing protein [Chitinophagaceae bacterium]